MFQLSYVLRDWSSAECIIGTLGNKSCVKDHGTTKEHFERATRLAHALATALAHIQGSHIHPYGGVVSVTVERRPTTVSYD